MPEEDVDDGAVMRIIKPGVATSAANRAETSSLLLSGVAKLDLLMSLELRARLAPAFYR